ncbi:SusC/RagA family TonB-linked outer membrane protein [Chryseobacterium chendengshani]|uniref:SusC/RagA family TonB-linked outer membrane protein n=1 Tax=Chryseobacterium sp. LJ668 TaxID=2864040 RepID=UPI001C68B774|nr:SusC/RagA family TonB-linked outer membrane protein [Chryseobacterium sp. LJ668]MBW8524044.1 SusC/RagA family TonB-linked outer membrane protein [Chryseobacterium sp. LJ668]QYK16980.1 SusC/RagA family TonB-linked outer membrane protein [Chryseobacterium sp. LJ668]
MRKETQKLLLLSLLGLVTVDMAAQQQVKKDTVKNIEEVVVTALGIKRQDRSLGYVAETIKSDELLKTQNNNWSQALEGKVAGLKIQTAGAGPLGSSIIKLRGDISMNPDQNNALIVVDGVPLNNNTTGTGFSAYGAGAKADLPIDYGNGINTINPDDIESITILKGSTASALYGSRGAGGAVMITTKSGKSKNGKVQVSLNSYSSYDTVLKWPDYQYEYGQGTMQKDTNGNYFYSYQASADGINTGATSSAFGPKFAGQYYFQYDPTTEGQSATRQLWQPYKNNIKDFWQTGTTFSNNISVEASNENTSFRSSLTYLKNEWMMPNTGFDRFNAAFSVDHKLSEKLKMGIKLNYNKTKSDNLPATGYSNQSISYFMIFQNPNVDLSWYRPIWKAGKDQIEQIHPFSSFIDNPYLIAYEMLNGVDKNFITGNVNVNYKIAKNFDVMLRSGMEITNEERTQKRPWNTANYLQGMYREQHVKLMDLNNDVLFTYKNTINDFDFSASAGGNIRYTEYTMNDYIAEGLLKPGLYTMPNGISTTSRFAKPSDKQVNSTYALANVSYKNRIFLDLTARNDWSSTLPVENRSYFYPSVATSFILSDIFSLSSDQFNYWKLRASWSKVGNDTDPYQLIKYYSNSDFTGSVESPSLYPNPNLRPNMITNIEAGMDFTILKNRINYTITAYQNNSKDQIIKIPMLWEAGYSTRVINAGEVRNRGLEMTLNTYPVKNRNFSWSVNANWSMNRNKILSIPAEFNGEPYVMGNVGGAVYFNAVVGGSLGDLYGYGLMYTPNGEVIYGSDGLTAKPTQMKKIGNAYPKWRAGLQNEFKYKNITLSFSFDGQYKGVAYSQSHHKMSEQGKLEHTLAGRDNPGGLIIGEGVVQNPDGSFSANTKGVLASAYYADYYRRANVETNTFDTSFIKLRDARIAYSFPKNITEQLKITDLTLALFGRNLWMWTEFPLFDPEVATLNDNQITPGVEMGQLPTARTVGIQLNVKF